jgi:hypothetical protein
LWFARTGSPWRDLPPSFGKWNTFFVRFAEVEPDVFLMLACNFYTTHESVLYKIDLRGWRPGAPMEPELFCTFPTEARGVNGCCLLAPGVLLAPIASQASSGASTSIWPPASLRFAFGSLTSAWAIKRARRPNTVCTLIEMWRANASALILHGSPMRKADIWQIVHVGWANVQSLGTIVSFFRSRKRRVRLNF